MTRKHFKRYVHESLSPSTQAAYAGDLRAFIRWGGKVPATAQLVARYLAAKAEVLKFNTLRRHLASIARAHVVKGIDSPTSSPLVKATLRGIMRVHGAKQKQATPVTPAMMRKLSRNISGFSKLRNARDRALLLLGFSGGFRQSELVNLRLGDLKFLPQGILIRLTSSKTDQYKIGRDVAIGYAKTALCAVTALKRWIQISSRYSNLTADLHVFRKVDRYDRLATAKLCGPAVGWILRRRLMATQQQPDGFSAHSLRAGFVSTATKLGVPVWAIQRQTGHKSANMVHRYIRGLSAFEQNAAAQVLALATR